MNLRALSKIRNKMTVGNIRNFPLSETGIIITITVGIAGLSPKQAEDEVAIVVADYKDRGEISKHVKFYKEYFFTSCEHNETKIDVTVI